MKLSITRICIIQRWICFYKPP